MKLVFLVFVLCVQHNAADVFKKCFMVYQNGFIKPKTTQNHCFTIKNTSDCLGTHPTTSNPILDHMRFYILQHAMFDIHIQLCEPYDYTQLRRIVVKTGLYKTFGRLFIDKVRSAAKCDLKCALSVHLASGNYYAEKKISTPEQLLCDDPCNLSRFYKKTAQNIKCNSKALRSFRETIWHIVPQLNKLILKRFNISCKPKV